MIEPQAHWHPFQSNDEMIEYLKNHQLLSQKATEAKPFYYRGEFSAELLPCQVVGWQDAVFAVIRVDGKLHSIHPDHLADMQPKKAELQALDVTATVPDESDFLQFSLGGDFAEEPPAPAKKPRKASVGVQEDAYTVIDLETTGLDCSCDEIIELAAIRVRSGQVEARFQSLVQCHGILPLNITEITGIAPEELVDAPMLEDILPDYLAFLGDDPLVGHNVTFDTGFLIAACAQLGLAPFEPVTIDTLKLSRKKLALSSYKLTAVRIALELPEHNAHRALDDCQTTMEVYEALKQRKDKPKRSSDRRFRGAALERHPELYPTEILSGPESPFYGKICVLTGELHIERDEAAALLEQAGATVKSGVTQKTNFLIVGVQDKSLVGEDGLSSKEEKALMLKSKGKADIQIIHEEQFCAMLSKDYRPSEPAAADPSAPESTAVPSEPIEEEIVEAEQFSFLNTESPEEQTYHRMESTIQSVIEQNFLEPSMLKFQQMASYWSVSCATALIARIRFGKTASYCSLDAGAAKELLDQAGISYEIKGSDSGFVRIALQKPEDILPCLPVIAAVTQRALDAIPKEFDCCGRVEQCSNAKRCVNPSSAMCIGCGYRKILASGRIFYGQNRNVKE